MKKTWIKKSRDTVPLSSILDQDPDPIGAVTFALAEPDPECILDPK